MAHSTPHSTPRSVAAIGAEIRHQRSRARTLNERALDLPYPPEDAATEQRYADLDAALDDLQARIARLEEERDAARAYWAVQTQLQAASQAAPTATPKANGKQKAEKQKAPEQKAEGRSDGE